MLRYLVPVMKLVSIRDVVGPVAWPELKDAEDAPVWATAVAAEMKTPQQSTVLR
jgi:hypothetical protein